MRLLFWMTVAIAGAFALLIGMYVHLWIEDTYPLNLVFFGHRHTMCLGPAAGLSIFALAATGLAVLRDRQRRRAGAAALIKG